MACPTCPRCGGFQEHDTTDTPAQYVCLACGRRTNVEPFEVLPYVSLQPIPGGGERRGR